ncbi:MAG: hypothetical protein FJX72_08360 [Armatimonadetes bacterium]|nr:hypothetical protein [Armatimonadota bacterium]
MLAHKREFPHRLLETITDTIVALRHHGTPEATAIADEAQARLGAIPAWAREFSLGRGDGMMVRVGPGSVKRTDAFVEFCAKILALHDISDYLGDKLEADPDLIHLKVLLRLDTRSVDTVQ